MFHFESDSGLTKLEVSPRGGGSAGVGWREDAMKNNGDKNWAVLSKRSSVLSAEVIELLVGIKASIHK